MLRMSVAAEEYVMIGDDIRLVFLGGTGNHMRIMIDAPRELNIVRSKALEKRIQDSELRAKMPCFYREEEHPEKYRRKNISNVRNAGTANTQRLSLHVGADGDDQNKISLEIDAMNAKSIGVSGLKVDTEENATETINTLNAAIKKVSEQRSALGAIQNRLEHTINNLDNVVENTTAAESQIRDTDMAIEMVKYSNNNILAQAGQAMLAQSNQANQGVLSLLQ